MDGRKAELLQRIEDDRGILIDFLRDFIRRASPNPPGDTREAAAHIRRLLDRHQVEYRVIAPEPTMPNIVARPYRRVPRWGWRRVDAGPVGWRAG
jgi:succinyl-diaminopimelate desuccinylase